jgi:hypothetical protein
MKKSGLITKLKSKFKAVLEIKKHDEANNVAWYIANVLDDMGPDTVTRRNIGFYVVSEGKAAEAAYWDKAEPKAAPPVDLLSQKIAAEASKFDHAQVEVVDAPNKSAVLIVAEADGAGYLKKRKLVKFSGASLGTVEVKDLTE